MRYFIEIAYDGTPFHGWQRQPNASSVQQTIEEALATMTRTTIPITGAGRTDTGVHARRTYAHFDIAEPIADLRRFTKSLDLLSGHHISIPRVTAVNSELHARFSATARVYRYYVQLDGDPFMRQYAWQAPSALDVDAMNECASLLLGTHDFTSFAKLHSDAKTNICTVTHAQWTPWENMYGIRGLVFEIKADRFLRNMVRAVVGTLVDAGRGKITPAGVAAIAEARNRCDAGSSMPARGLYLWDVQYPSQALPTLP